MESVSYAVGFNLKPVFLRLHWCFIKSSRIIYLQFPFAVYPWTYRHLLLDYFDTEEHLKTRWFSGEFCCYKQRLFLWFLRGFMDVYSQWKTRYNNVSHTESKSMCIISVCSDLKVFSYCLFMLLDLLYFLYIFYLLCLLSCTKTPKQIPCMWKPIWQ